MTPTLSIQHNIYLNKEDRYALHDGQEIEVIGVSVPVWHNSIVSSEPAREIFCRYFLKNSGDQIPIKVWEDGYEIVLPTKLKKKNVEDEEKIKITSTKSLLDYVDGGGRCLMYREHNKMKTNGRMLSIVHYVTISAEETLLVNLSMDNLSITFPTSS